MAVNLLSKFGKALDQSFSKGSYTEKAVNNNYDFTGAKTIDVLTIEPQALKDYNRAEAGDRYGGNNELQDTKTSYTLSKDRAFKITIDKGNYQDQGELKKAGIVLKEQMNKIVYPEIDKHRLLVASKAVTANSQKVVFKPEDAYDNVLDLNVFMDEAEVPESQKYLFVKPSFYKAVKKQIVTTAQAPNTNDSFIKKGYVGEIDGIPVIKVPASYLPANFEAIMWHKDAMLAPNKIAETRIITDSELVSGSVLVGRFYYDAFVLNGKKNAVAGITKA